MPLDVPQATILLRLPFGGNLLVEGRVDGAVELVHISGVDAVLEPVVLGAQFLDGFLMLALLVGVAIVKSVPHPVEHLVVERQPAEERAELLFENFFPDIGFVAFPLVAGAVIVDVALLLDLADHRAAAMAAGDQAREGEIMLHAAVLAGVTAVHHVLHPLPQVPRDQGLVAALVKVPVPFELAHVKPVAQDLVHRAGRHCLAALPVAEAVRARLLRHVAQCQPAGCVAFEHPGHMRRNLGIGLDHPLAVGAVHVAVAERRRRRPDALLGLLQHALPGLFRQIVDVVLRHQNLDAVHELFRRLGVARQDRAFLDEMNLAIEVVEHHPVLEIAIKPVGLFDQDDTDPGIGPQKRDHLGEAGPAGLLRRLHVDVFLNGGQPFARGIVLQQLQLRRDREAFLFLLLGGYAGIDHRLLADGIDGGCGLRCPGHVV